MGLDRLYVVTRNDLTASARAVQCCHATAEFLLEHKELWENQTLVLLAVRDEFELVSLRDSAVESGLAVKSFCEPDLRDALTAFAAHGEKARTFFRRLPLLK